MGVGGGGSDINLIFFFIYAVQDCFFSLFALHNFFLSYHFSKDPSISIGSRPGSVPRHCQTTHFSYKKLKQKDPFFSQLNEEEKQNAVAGKQAKFLLLNRLSYFSILKGSVVELFRALTRNPEVPTSSPLFAGHAGINSLLFNLSASRFF